MPRAIAVASGTADVQGVTGDTTLVGFMVRESAAVAAVASLVLRNGTLATDPVVAFVELVADESRVVPMPAIACPGGVFVDREAGTTELVLYIL